MGDFDGDGRADIVALTQSTTGDVHVAVSNGTNAFVDRLKWNEYFSLSGELIRVGDINGDRKADLVTTVPSNSDVYSAFSRGFSQNDSGLIGGFFEHGSFAGTGDSVVIGDFNGDGQSDLAKAGTGVASISVLIANTAIPSVPLQPGKKVADEMRSFIPGGTVGFYLKEVNGPVLAAKNEDFLMDPASTLKLITHTAAAIEIQYGYATLGTSIPNIVNNCNVGFSGTETLGTAMDEMMFDSDNDETQSIRQYIGVSDLNTMIDSMGMTQTDWAAGIGCGVANLTTLEELGKMLESISRGLLTPAMYEVVTEHMCSYPIDSSPAPTSVCDFRDLTPNTSRGVAFMSSRATAFGYGGTDFNKFKCNSSLMWKSGSIAGGGLNWHAEAGILKLPFRAADGSTETKQYVWGVFAHAASSIDCATCSGGDFPMQHYAAVLMQDLVSAALASWVGSFGSLPSVPSDCNTSF